MVKLDLKMVLFLELQLVSRKLLVILSVLVSLDTEYMDLFVIVVLFVRLVLLKLLVEVALTNSRCAYASKWVAKEEDPE